LILLNGIFALSEIAIVSSRRARLQSMAADGNKGAEIALELATAPTQFLSTVQIGITLIAIVAGAFGGATLARELTPLLENLPVVGTYAATISFVLVVGSITFFSVVIGELVPKRIGLQDPERIAVLVARPMYTLSRVAAPIVRLLSLATEAVLRLIGIKDSDAAPVSEEEIRILVQESAAAGIIEPEEREMVESVFRFGDLQVGRLMTPRTDIIWLDVNATEAEIRIVVEHSVHTRFPVCDGELDKVLGIVRAKDLLARTWSGQEFDLRATLQEPLYLPESMPALRALERFKATGTHLGLLVDEFGGIEGLVTLINILETLVGDIPTSEEMAEPPIVQRDDGSYLVDGMFLIDELKAFLGIAAFPSETAYNTLGGFIVTMIGQMPQVGASCLWAGYRFEVVDIDGLRIDKVLIELASSDTEDNAVQHSEE
jgi:putative hemolysin